MIDFSKHDRYSTPLTLEITPRTITRLSRMRFEGLKHCLTLVGISQPDMKFDVD